MSIRRPVVRELTARGHLVRCYEIEAFREKIESADVIVSDSVCFWSKLFARKHGVPFVCSTTRRP